MKKIGSQNVLFYAEKENFNVNPFSYKAMLNIFVDSHPHPPL